MFKVFQNESGWYLDITYSGEVSNIIPLAGPSRGLPEDFGFAEEGSGWLVVDTVVTITGGTLRYTTNKNDPPGHWYTNIHSTSNLMMQTDLKLGSNNTAEYKHRVWIEPTTIAVSYIPHTQNVQVYIWDTGKIKLLESTGTNFNFTHRTQSDK